MNLRKYELIPNMTEFLLLIYSSLKKAVFLDMLGNVKYELLKKMKCQWPIP